MADSSPPSRLFRAFTRMRGAAATVEERVDRARLSLRRRNRTFSPVQIVPYRGYGTPSALTLHGRVLEARAVEPLNAADRRWRNFVHMIHRLESDEIPGVRLRARFGEATAESVTDEEGYFSFVFSAPHLAEGEGPWYSIALQLEEEASAGQGPVESVGEVLVPHPLADFGIISDIDDTIIQTHVTNTWRMLKVTMLGNARTRLPFEGTTELYRALVAGPTGAAANPVFYVSKSPWNLYDLLTDFMERHDLPRGPLMLRDLGLRRDRSYDHKRTQIRQILATYPRLTFVCIGDSGERDPEIYLDIAAEHPGRVRAIYIREVGSKFLRGTGAEMAAKARALGADMLFMTHAGDALVHARTAGLVAP